MRRLPTIGRRQITSRASTGRLFTSSSIVYDDAKPVRPKTPSPSSLGKLTPSRVPRANSIGHINLSQESFKIHPAAAPSNVSRPDLKWTTGPRVVHPSFAQRQAQKRMDDLKRIDELAPYGLGEIVDQPAPHNKQQEKRAASSRESRVMAEAEDLRKVQLYEERWNEKKIAAAEKEQAYRESVQRASEHAARIRADNEKRRMAARTSSSGREVKRKQEKNAVPKDFSKKQKPKRVAKKTPVQTASLAIDETLKVQFQDTAKVVIPRPVSEIVQEEIEAIRAAYPSHETTASNSATTSDSGATTSSSDHSPEPEPELKPVLTKARIKMFERRAGDYSAYLPWPLGQGRTGKSLGPVAYAQSILARRRDAGLGKRREAVKIIRGFVGKSELKAARL